jgi:capsid protein
MKIKGGLRSRSKEFKDRKRSVEKVSRRVLRIKSELALLELSRDKTITCM